MTQLSGCCFQTQKVLFFLRTQKINGVEMNRISVRCRYLGYVLWKSVPFRDLSLGERKRKNNAIRKGLMGLYNQVVQYIQYKAPRLCTAFSAREILLHHYFKPRTLYSFPVSNSDVANFAHGKRLRDPGYHCGTLHQLLLASRSLERRARHERHLHPRPHRILRYVQLQVSLK